MLRITIEAFKNIKTKQKTNSPQDKEAGHTTVLPASEFLCLIILYKKKRKKQKVYMKYQTTGYAPQAGSR